MVCGDFSVLLIQLVSKYFPNFLQNCRHFKTEIVILSQRLEIMRPIV